MYEHVRGGDHYDAQTLDAATAEQTQSQSNIEKPLEESDVEMDEEEAKDEETKAEQDFEIAESDNLVRRVKGQMLY